jgi:hypothetical protein
MMKQANRVKMVAVAALILLVAVAVSVPSVSSAQPKGEAFVIGYIGMVASPGTRPCMDIQKMAVEEINAMGGIMGRPVKYVVMDNKGDTSLSVEALRKLVIEDKAKFVSVEGRSEICLRCRSLGMLAKEYPHILVFNGPMGAELTARIIDQAPKYDHCFRDWDPEPAHYAQTKYFFCKTMPQYQKTKRIAFLWEDLAWTTEWRRGIGYINLPTWEKMAQECGLEVVYSKAVKPRGTSICRFPDIKKANADLIFFISLDYDTESFASSGRFGSGTSVNLYAASRRPGILAVTGGKGLGSSAPSRILMIVPLPPEHPLVKKPVPKIPMQIHVHIAYGIFSTSSRPLKKRAARRYQKLTRHGRCGNRLFAGQGEV